MVNLIIPYSFSPSLPHNLSQSLYYRALVFLTLALSVLYYLLVSNKERLRRRVVGVRRNHRKPEEVEAGISSS